MKTNRKQRESLLVCLLGLTVLCGYLPGNWNTWTAKEDPDKSHAIAIGRVIGIEMAGEKITRGKTSGGKEYSSRLRWYRARFRVGEVLKGDLAKDVEVMIPVGDDLEMSDVGNVHDLTPAYRNLTMCNTQAAYDLRINQVYLMYLVYMKNDEEAGWDLRSGPYSLGWIQPENKLCFGALGQKWQDPVETDKYLAELKEKLAAGRVPEPPR